MTTTAQQGNRPFESFARFVMTGFVLQWCVLGLAVHYPNIARLATVIQGGLIMGMFWWVVTATKSSAATIRATARFVTWGAIAVLVGFSAWLTAYPPLEVVCRSAGELTIGGKTRTCAIDGRIVVAPCRTACAVSIRDGDGRIAHVDLALLSRTRVAYPDDFRRQAIEVALIASDDLAMAVGRRLDKGVALTVRSLSTGKTTPITLTGRGVILGAHGASSRMISALRERKHLDPQSIATVPDWRESFTVGATYEVVLDPIELAKPCAHSFTIEEGVNVWPAGESCF